MKTKTPAPGLLLAAVSLLAPLTFAQSAGSVSGAAQNAAANASQNATAASRAASASAANAVGIQASAAHSPATTGVTSNAVAATTAAGASIPTTKGTLNAGLANSATVPGKRDEVSTTVHGTATAPGLSVEGNPGGKIAASLNRPATAEHIRNATKTSRDDVFNQIDFNIDAAKRSLADLRSSLHDSSKATRERFETAEDQLRLREKALRQSLKDARRASDENAVAAQAKAAADYEAYVNAVAQTEAAAGGSASAVVGVKR